MGAGSPATSPELERRLWLWMGMWAKRGHGSHSREPIGPQNDENRRISGGFEGGSDRRRSGDLSIFSRTLYQLSYRAVQARPLAVRSRALRP